jgi:hypothetical protein
MIAPGIGLHAHDDVRQCPIGAVRQRVLVIDFVDRIRRNQSRADYFLELLNDLV